MRIRHLVLGTFLSMTALGSFVTAAEENRLDGFVSNLTEARIIDPDFASVGADQDLSNGSHYGIALYDLGKKLATFVPEGETQKDVEMSSRSHNEALLKMIKDAKLLNKDPTSKLRAHLVLVGDEIHVIEVAKDDSSALKKKVAELAAKVSVDEARSSAEFKERAENKFRFANEIDLSTKPSSKKSTH